MATCWLWKAEGSSMEGLDALVLPQVNWITRKLNNSHILVWFWSHNNFAFFITSFYFASDNYLLSHKNKPNLWLLMRVWISTCSKTNLRDFFKIGGQAIERVSRAGGNVSEQENPNSVPGATVPSESSPSSSPFRVNLNERSVSPQELRYPVSFREINSVTSILQLRQKRLSNFLGENKD